MYFIWLGKKCPFFVGKFYQHDGMIFPEKPEKQTKGMWETLKKLFFSTSEDKELSRPHYSLLIHLERHKKILCNLEVTENKRTIQNVVNSVYNIYEQCRSVKFCYNNHFGQVLNFDLRKVS